MSLACSLGAVGGCGGGGGRVIDHTVVEKAIEVGIAQQQHVLSIVTCPLGLHSRTGLKFTCEATLADGRQYPINAVARDDKGNIHYSGLPGFVRGRPPAGG